MPSPTCRKRLRSFLGMVDYVERFIPHLQSISYPRYQLTSTKQKWYWNGDFNRHFQNVKNALLQWKLNVPYDLNKPLLVMSDASKYGLGDVLAHKNLLGELLAIQFVSRHLTKPEQNYDTIDREAHAVIYAIKGFHEFLCRRNFPVLCNHKRLCLYLE
ncbi:hypothetical protein GJ496_008914 [Pomphorhynchus laevis]|nr:hypothetical protein GJ496_008914 [Pomphorhynchus laevis]